MSTIYVNTVNVASGSTLSIPVNISSSGETNIGGNLKVSGSTIFGNASSDTHQFTGSVAVSGTIFANKYQVSIIDTSEGSTIFGNDSSDTHNFTGSILAQKISASAGGTFVGGLITNTLEVSGAATLKGKLSSSAAAQFGGGVTLSSTLAVSGAVTLAGDNTVKDDKKVIFGETGAGSGEAFIMYREATDNLLEISGGAAGLVLSGSNINLVAYAPSGMGPTYGNVIITGSTLMAAYSPVSSSSGATFGGASVISNALNVTGALTLAGKLSSSAAAQFGGGVTLSSTLKISGSITGSGIASGTLAGQGSYVGVNAHGGMILAQGTNVAALTTAISSSKGGTFAGPLILSNPLNVSGAATLAGKLSSSAAAQFGGGMTVNGTLAVSGAATFAANGAAITLAATNPMAGTANISSSGGAIFGNPVIATSTLQVSGAATLAGNVSSSAAALFGGIATFTNAVNVSGAATIVGKLSSSAAAQFGGGVTLSSTLAVSGAVTLAGDNTVKDDKKVIFGDGSDAHIMYREATDNLLEISGGAGGMVLSGSNINLVAYFQSGMGPIYGNVIVTGSLLFDANSNISSSAGATFLKPVVISNALNVSGATVVSSSLTVNPKKTAAKLVFEQHHTGTLNPTNLDEDEAAGEVVYMGTGSCNLGYVYYLNTDGGWNLINAAGTGSVGSASAGNASLIGMSLGAEPHVNGMLIRGFAEVDASYVGAWVTGSAVYVHSASAPNGAAIGGQLSGAAPTTSDSYVRIAGYCTAKKGVIYFNPDSTWVENS